jgi:lysophospholipase L1-like esterase
MWSRVINFLLSIGAGLSWAVVGVGIVGGLVWPLLITSSLFVFKQVDSVADGPKRVARSVFPLAVIASVFLQPRGSDSPYVSAMLVVVSLASATLRLKLHTQRLVSVNILVALVLLVGGDVVWSMADPIEGVAAQVESLRSRYPKTTPIIERDPLTNVEAGIRRTCCQPQAWSHTVWALGGSTTFGELVRDDETWPSRLQVLLGATGDWRVINLGVRGMTTRRFLRRMEVDAEVQPGDVVIAYFGVNEAASSLSSLGFVDRQLMKFQVLNAGVSWLSGRSRLTTTLLQLSGKGFPTVQSAVEREVDRNLADLAIATRRRGATLVTVLQPNLYTESTLSDYEKDLLGLYEPMLQTAVLELYPSFWAHAQRHGTALRLDEGAFRRVDSERSVYVDWAHMSARGYEVVGARVYQHVRRITDGVG